MIGAGEEATLQIGETEIAIRRRRRSSVLVAGILGREVRDGRERVYLDSLIHGPCVTELDGWQVSGAISTILTRELPAGASTHL